MTPIAVAFSIGLLFYTVSVNQPRSPDYTYAWQKQDIAPYNSPMSHFSVATFFFPKGYTAFSIVFNTSNVTVEIQSIIVSDNSVFMAYNWTGGNWTLYFGMQTPSNLP